MYHQHPPYAIQVEPTEGCNLRCPFCGINGIRDERRIYQYMSLATAANLAGQLRVLQWRSRIEFAVHGEPTKNPEFARIVQYLRQALPKNYFLLETNGSGLIGATSAETRENLQLLFTAGLNTIAVDEYQGIRWANQLRTTVQKAKVPYTVYEYPAQMVGNPHHRTRPDTRQLVFVAPIDLATKGTHSCLNNHCGAGAPLDPQYTQHWRCAKPFRELTIRYDGNVAICCNDWRGVYKVGNILTDGVYAVWHSPQFQAARRKLLHYQRDFMPCLGCNARSYRPGLLPDPRGRETLPKPDKRCQQTVLTAAAGTSYTPAVLRPWEQKLVQIKSSELTTE